MILGSLSGKRSFDSTSKLKNAVNFERLRPGQFQRMKTASLELCRSQYNRMKESCQSQQTDFLFARCSVLATIQENEKIVSVAIE